MTISNISGPLIEPPTDRKRTANGPQTDRKRTFSDTQYKNV